MKEFPNRLVIYTKDIMNITGRSERTARRMLTAIRKQQGKGAHSLITLTDFCSFTGLKEEQVIPFLRF